MSLSIPNSQSHDIQPLDKYLENTELQASHCDMARRNCSKKTVLLLGSSGFIGKKLTDSLCKKGLNLRTPDSKQVDFLNPDLAQITHFIKGVDAVVNMVGVMSQDPKLLEQIHYLTPIQIAKLAKKFHVKQWINLSALGADSDHQVAFLSSKGRGDADLLALADKDFQVSVVRPSLVFGRGGVSTEMFVRLAKLPFLILPERGNYLIQPVHVNDVVQGLVTLVSQPECRVTLDSCCNSKYQEVINFTGAETATFAEYLISLRCRIHSLPPPLIMSIPRWFAQMGLSVLTSVMNSRMLTKDSLQLLAEGSTADNQLFTQLLRYEPLSYRQFKSGL